MDADDVSSPHWLQTQMDFLKQNPKIDVVSCHWDFFGDREFILKRPFLDSQIKSAFLLDCTFGTGGSMIKMKKIRANKIFFNEQLESAEDYDYWVKSFSVLSFAAVDKILYRYRIHNAQESETNKEKQRKIHLLTVQKHLLKFNIKTDLEIIKIILHWNDKEVDSHASQKFQEAVSIFDKIFTIKNFYGYSCIEKSAILHYYLNLLKYLCYSRLFKKNHKKVKEFFEDILKEYPVVGPIFVLTEIYRVYKTAGLKGKLFFIKDFGLKNYFKIKAIVGEKKSSMPLLTVLMPVYNAEKFLAESISSILKQTYSDFELLILDDGSTDNSLKIIKAYAKEDKRIKILVNKTNQKQAKCRNRLLKNSKTEFIAWMDADDISLEDRLQTQMDFLKQNPKIDAVGTQYSSFGSSGNLPANFTSHFSLSDIEIKTNFIFGYDLLFPSSLMRMKKIKQHNLFFDNNYKLSTGVDQQYIIDCFSFMKFVNLDKVLYQYRQDSNQTTTINQKQILNNANAITRKHLLKFNIKADSETIHFFMQWIDKGLINQKFPKTVKVFDKIFFIKGKFDVQKFQKVLGVIYQIVSLKKFYDYSRLEKSFFFPYYFNLEKYFHQGKFLKNNIRVTKKIKEIFENILKQYFDYSLTTTLRHIYSHYRKAGLKGKLSFIKDYGLKNYLKVKKW